MSDEVIIISDSDTEPADKYGYKSDDSDIVILSVSSPPPEPPSSQPSAWGDVSGIWKQSDSEEDKNSEMEFPTAAAIVSASQSQKTGSQRSGVASSQPQACSSVSTTPESRKRKSFAYSSDSEESLAVEPSPKKPAKRRKKKTEEEKALEKAEKEAKKLAKQEETRRKKEAIAAEKAAEKLSKKAHKDANKLVSSKKDTLKDMTIELSPPLMNSTLLGSIREKMDEFDCVVSPITDPFVENSAKAKTNLNDLGLKLIRWKRHVTAKYDEISRQWVLLEEPHTRTEGTYLIFVQGRDVLRQDKSVTNQVRAIRQALGPKHHIHLMLCGWKPSKKEESERVEEVLVGLQVLEGIFVEQVPNEEEAVNWIYNMTADLGIKPHKLIERSHLPFCVGASTAKVGKSDEDTLVNMFTRLRGVTDPMARAVARDYGTVNRIMEAYVKTENEYAGSGAMMLADVEVNKTKKGKEASRVLNKALSSRLYTIMWGEDPKALVN